MFFLVPSLPRLLFLKAKHEYRQLYVILDNVEVLKEQNFSQGQNHNYRKVELGYRRRFNTQLIITLFSMWWLLKEPFDLIRSCCPPYFLAAFFGDFFATFLAGFFAAGFLAAGFFAAGFLTAGFFTADFLAAGFFTAAGFFAVFLAAGFFAAFLAAG